MKNSNMTAPGMLYIIAAPSGAGKTSLIHRLTACTADVEVSISHTTRPLRPGERDGVAYHFVDHETFQTLIRNNVFLEYAQVFDYFYGTSRRTVLERIQQGIDIILEIDWQGARQIRALIPNNISIFILPSSLEALRQRLRSRGQDRPEVIERRMRDAVNEMSHYDEFDYIVINEDFQEALANLRAIFIARRQLRAAQKIRHRNLLKNLLS